MKFRTLSIWTKAPFARIVLLLLLGIGTSQLVELASCEVPLSGLAVFMLIGSRLGKMRYAYSLRQQAGALNAMALVLLMASHTSLTNQPAQAIHISDELFYVMDCLSSPRETSTSWKVETKIRNGPHCGRNALIYLKKPCAPPSTGEKVIIKARISSLDSCEFLEPGYINFLEQRKISGIAFGATCMESLGNRSGISSACHQIRSYFVEVLRSHNIEGDALGIICAMTLGTREYLPTDLRDSYAASGAIHILAVSGLHVGIVYMLLSRLFRSALRSTRFKYATLSFILLILWTYALLTGFSPSVLRAATMFSFLAIGRISERPTNIYNTLAASAVFLLLIEPELIFSLSFQLSYLAVIGIIYLQPRIFRWFYFRNRILRWLWELTAVSIAAQLATFPLSLHYFGQFPNYFVLTNWIAIPSATAILVVGLVFFILHGLPWISEASAWLLGSLTELLNWGIRVIERLPGSLTQGIECSWETSLILYTLLVAVLLWLETKKAAHLKRLLVVCIVGVIVVS